MHISTQLVGCKNQICIIGLLILSSYLTTFICFIVKNNLKNSNDKQINPDPLGSKNITIHYPGAIFGTFIINQLPWSLFWQFWYLIVHWFKFKKLAILSPGAFFGTFWKIKKKNFFTKNNSLYRKNKSQIFPEFLYDYFSPKKIK